MPFKTYWDLSERERAALAADDVERFAATELMRLGVLQVGLLVKEPEPVTVELPVQTYYQIEIAGQYARERLPLLFHSIDDAKAVLALDPWLAKEERLNDDWSQRRDVAHLLGTHALSPTIVLSEMCAAHDFAKARAELSKRSAIRAANDKREEEWVKEKQKEDDALKGMWTDWQACRLKAAAHRRIADTFEAYATTAGGDREVAFRFLRKVFTDSQVATAAEWCGFTAPGAFYFADGERIEEFPQQAPEPASR